MVGFNSQQSGAVPIWWQTQSTLPSYLGGPPEDKPPPSPHRCSWEAERSSEVDTNQGLKNLGMTGVPLTSTPSMYLMMFGCRSVFSLRWADCANLIWGHKGQECDTTYRQCLQLVLDVGVCVIPWLTSSSLLSVKSNINTVTASPVD